MFRVYSPIQIYESFSKWIISNGNEIIQYFMKNRDRMDLSIHAFEMVVIEHEIDFNGVIPISM